MLALISSKVYDMTILIMSDMINSVLKTLVILIIKLINDFHLQDQLRFEIKIGISNFLTNI